MIGVALALGLQASAWMTRPAAPTVGDTVVLERMIPTAAGALGRTRPLQANEQLEPLGLPAITPAPGGILVRHAVALFAPGTHRIPMPAIEVLHPDGTVEAILGDTAVIAVAPVVPDSVRDPRPMPSQAPIPRAVRDLPRALTPVVAALLVLGAWLAWRVRPPRAARQAAAVVPPVELSLMRWLAAGERRAVATVAAHRLRTAVAAAIPASATVTDADDWAATVGATLPDWPVAELADVLRALERARFAPLAADDLAELVDRTDVLLGQLRAVEPSAAS
jgi:hypothetical protein